MLFPLPSSHTINGRVRQWQWQQTQTENVSAFYFFPLFFFGQLQSNPKAITMPTIMPHLRMSLKSSGRARQGIWCRCNGEKVDRLRKIPNPWPNCWLPLFIPQRWKVKSCQPKLVDCPKYGIYIYAMRCIQPETLTSRKLWETFFQLSIHNCQRHYEIVEKTIIKKNAMKIASAGCEKLK